MLSKSVILKYDLPSKYRLLWPHAIGDV